MLQFLLLLAAPPPQHVGGELSQIRLIEARPALPLRGPVCPFGDRDRDGFPDFAFSNPTWRSPGWMREVGLVATFSGDRGLPFGYFVGTMLRQGLGTGMADAGDVDADGQTDLILGTYQQVNHIPDQFVRVLSGADGSILFEEHRRGRFTTLGLVVGAAGDFDQDGHADFFYTDQAESDHRGAVTLISGRTGTPIRVFRGGPDHEIGRSAVFFGDADDDGVSDLAVGNHFHAPPYGAGRVGCFSGASGQLLWERTGEEESWFSLYLAAVGDVDLDGRADLLASADGAGLNREGMVQVLSGRDGSEIRRHVGQPLEREFGSGLLGGPDLDSDGIREYMINAPRVPYPGGTSTYGATHLYSGADGSLIASFFEPIVRRSHAAGTFLGTRRGDRADLFIVRDNDHVSSRGGVGALEIWAFDPFLRLDGHELSAATGGQIRAELQFPEARAGADYLLLFSASGRGPSDWRGLPLPLTQDALFLASEAGQYPPWVQNPVGRLDADARAVVILQPTAQDLTAHVGRTLHFAAVLLDPVSGAPVLSSVAAAVRIRP